jgi:hypothetical protein
MHLKEVEEKGSKTSAHTDAGWDFYGHPGILDDTKSSDLTQNICQNQRIWLRNVKKFHTKKSMDQNPCHRSKIPLQG